MTFIACGIATIGLVVVFGFYRNQTKPTFVKTIWAFITLEILTGITQINLLKYDANLEEVGK